MLARLSPFDGQNQKLNRKLQLCGIFKMQLVLWSQLTSMCILCENLKFIWDPAYLKNIFFQK